MGAKKQKKELKFGELSRRKQIIASLYSIWLGEQIESFYEDLSILLNSGMDIVTAVRIIHDEIRSFRMRKILSFLLEEIESGASFAHTLEQLNIAPRFILALVKVGEDSGRLAENLGVAVKQLKRVKEFLGSVRSAMIYPAVVLSLALLVGLGTTWFVIPRLTGAFESLNVELPALTRGMIAFGNFISDYGATVIPGAAIIFAVAAYFLFVFRRTRFIGAQILFILPVARYIIRHSEVARFGYLFGVLLQAGLPIIKALDSIREATELKPYYNFYTFMRKKIESGESFKEIFKKYKHSTALIPTTAQYMIEAGERSGSLPEALLSIGEAYEGKTSSHLKNITTILEPAIIIVVGLGIALVAFSILMPVYSLIGGIR